MDRMDDYLITTEPNVEASYHNTDDVENGKEDNNATAVEAVPSGSGVNVDNAEALDRRKPKSYLWQYVATLTATLSAFSAGIVLGWTSPIVDSIKDGNYTGSPVTDDQMGWIGSLTTIGAMLTCIPTGFLCDFIGAKLTLLILFIPYSTGWTMIIFAKNLVTIYLGRFITGIAAGATCIAAPMYISEIAEKEIRGSLGGYFQLMVTVGVLYAYVFGAIANVHLYTVLCSLIPILFFISFVFQPKSPTYLLKKGRYEEAKAALIRLRSKDINVEEELNETERMMKNNQPNLGVMILFKKKATIKALLLSLALMCFQQLSGINAVIFYTSNIFKDAEIKLDPAVATIIVGACQVVATFISTLIMDKLGRRALLIFSTFFMSFSMILLAIFFTLKEHALVSHDVLVQIGFLPVLALVMYIVIFSLGLGPIPWIINGEIFAPEIKGVASSIAGSFNWFLAFLITRLYLQVDKKIGEDGTFFFFAFILMFAAVFIYFLLPETKGKTIAEIQEELERT